jgi:hypothetical protein
MKRRDNGSTGVRVALLLAAGMALPLPAHSGADVPGQAYSPTVFQPVTHPLAWHREHWRQRSYRDPDITIEVPWEFLGPYLFWPQPPQPGKPPRPAEVQPRERGDIWRDDVVGAGSGERIETHPEGRVLRSRPRSD